MTNLPTTPYIEALLDVIEAGQTVAERKHGRRSLGEWLGRNMPASQHSGRPTERRHTIANRTGYERIYPDGMIERGWTEFVDETWEGFGR